MEHNNKTAKIVKLSVMTKSRGLLTKVIRTEGNGIKKDNSKCWMDSGTCATVELNGLSELPDVIAGLAHNQALVHGINGKPQNRILAGKKLKNNNSGAISRTKDFFHYPTSNALTMFDVDPEHGGIEKFDDIYDGLCKVVPGFKAAGKVISSSASSYIYDKDNKLVSNSLGCHIYFLVKDGNDIARFAEAAFKRAWLHGYGFIKISRAGSLLVRNYLFDQAVFSPERLDFAAGAKCIEPLYQKRPKPKYQGGGALDTSALPDLTPDEEKEYNNMVAAEKAKVKPEAEKTQQKYFTAKIPEIIKKHKKLGNEISESQAKKIIDSRIKGDLYSDDVLTFDDYGDATVADVLTGKDKFNMATLADPLEPEEGHCKAKFFFNEKDRKPIVYTQLHGGRTFFLHAETADKNLKFGGIWSFEDAEIYIKKLSEKDLDSTQKINIVNDIFLNQKFTPVAMDLLQDLVKKLFHINKGTIAELLKNKEAETGEGPPDHTHIEICEIFLLKLEADYQAFTGCEGSLWVYGKDTDGLYIEKKLSQVEIMIGKDNTKEQKCQRGSDYKAVTRLVYNSKEDENFFSAAPYGLPGKSKFYSIDHETYEIKPVSYSHRLKQRFKLSQDPAEKINSQEAPFFKDYLDFAFRDDELQKKALQEIFGALVCGLMKHLQKAVLLYGSGENGKSVLLDLLAQIFPDRLRCAVKPERMDNEYYQAMLSGKMINIVGEIEKSKPIKAEFKDIVGADTPITARCPYGEPYSFIPQAGHIFSTNDFPQTKDHSHGFYRRWAVVVFTNKVDAKGKIPRLGEKIAKKEMPQVLAWALEGARRLIENNFILTETEQHKNFMNNWQNTGDSVFNFLNDEEILIYQEQSCVRKQDLYKIYMTWCFDNAGVRPVGRNRFYERVSSKLSETRLHSAIRVYNGVAVSADYPGCILTDCGTHFSYEDLNF